MRTSAIALTIVVPAADGTCLLPERFTECSPGDRYSELPERNRLDMVETQPGKDE